MSRRVRVGVGTVVSAVVLAALLWFTDPAQIWDTLSAADLRWIAAATLVNVATVPVMGWRWQLLLRAKGIAVPIAWLTRTYFVALFLGQFLPAAIGGAAVRAVQAVRLSTIWMLVQALRLDVPLSEIFAAGPVLFAALILPVSLNGIGVREAVFVSFLRDSTTAEQAIALGVAFFAVGTATALVGAPILLVRWARYGLQAVRPRTRIEEDVPASEVAPLD